MKYLPVFMTFLSEDDSSGIQPTSTASLIVHQTNKLVTASLSWGETYQDRHRTLWLKRQVWQKVNSTEANPDLLGNRPVLTIVSTQRVAAASNVTLKQLNVQKIIILSQQHQQEHNHHVNRSQ